MLLKVHRCEKLELVSLTSRRLQACRGAAGPTACWSPFRVGTSGAGCGALGHLRTPSLTDLETSPKVLESIPMLDAQDRGSSLSREIQNIWEHILVAFSGVCFTQAPLDYKNHTAHTFHVVKGMQTGTLQSKSLHPSESWVLCGARAWHPLSSSSSVEGHSPPPRFVT